MNVKFFSILLSLVLLTSVVGLAETLIVGGDSADFQTIQSAIDAAAEGDVIQVNAGVYHEALLITKNQIDIVGAGSEQTTIEYTDTVVSYLFSARSSLEGFTVSYIGTEDRPAIMVDASSPQLSHNTITGATLAGIEIQSGANAQLQDNLIANNLGSGVLVYLNARVTLTDNVIRENGLGLVSHPGVEIRGAGEGELDNNNIWLNGGSGVFLHEAAFARLTSNSIIGNNLHGVAVENRSIAELTSNSILWHTEAGVRLKASREVTLSGNLIAHNLLGTVGDDEAELPTQTNNIYLANRRDTFNVGFSSQDALMTNRVFSSPNGQSLLQQLSQMGESITNLKIEITQSLYQSFIGNLQNIELIVAGLYNEANFSNIATARYNIVIRLDENSVAADEARSNL